MLGKFTETTLSIEGWSHRYCQ